MTPELLAPAGGEAALRAALANGADAVYLGAAAFGARAGAGFDDGALAAAARLCHLHNRKLYVTVNTLAREEELPGVRRTLERLRALAADAVLVQDLGVLALLREEFPELTVHASTQMTIHNAAGARFLRSRGVSRAVLARECALEDIRAVAAAGIEAEVFVHGALCVSVSGQCLMSALAGGRSGNRGRCAQPCRMAYTLGGQRGAWLSMRDLCLLGDLDALRQAGVASLKIEGRLRRPEYVAVVTRIYRQALDGTLRDVDAAREALLQIFQRGGFTRGHAMGMEDAALLSPGRVGHGGVPAGVVRGLRSARGALLCDVALTRAAHDGDSFQVRGARDQDATYSGHDVPAGGVLTLRLREKARLGDAVYRLADARQLAAARFTYEGAALDGALPIPFDAHLTAVPGEAAALTVTDGTHTAAVRGEVVRAASARPLTQDAVRAATGKTGGTPFVLRDVTFTGENAYLPAAALNALRREALAALSEARARRTLPPRAGARMRAPARERALERPLVLAQSGEAREAGPLMDAGADAFLFEPDDYTPGALATSLARLPRGAYLCLPAFARDGVLEDIARLTRAHAARLCGVVLGNAGQLALDFGVPVATGAGVPVYNNRAMDVLRAAGARWMTASPELSGTQLAALSQGELAVQVYGRERVMLLAHCPVRAQRGQSAGRASCRLCDTGNGARGQALTDTLRHAFPLAPLRMPEGCQVRVYNALPTCLAAQARKLGDAYAWVASFTDEDAAARLAIVRALRALAGGAPCERGTFPPGTLGRYKTGVE